NLLIDIKTIHLLLNIKEGKEKYFDDSRLDYDLVIIDEASMLDFKLMAYLLHSIKKGSRIVFIGDSNQLPPIAAGNVFTELTNMKNLVTDLDLPKRFENQKIIEMADAVKTEDETKLFSLIDNDIFFNIDNLDVKKIILEFSGYNPFHPTSEKLNIEKILDKVNEFKILSSIKNGPWGLETINNEILTFFLKKAKAAEYLYIPVIVTKNNYKLSLFNGQIGILQAQVISNKLSISAKSDIYFKIEDKVVNYPIASVRAYELAYAISIHKSQGSEFCDAIIILPDGSQNFGKELLYTAITRVKNNLKIVSSKIILEQLLKKSSIKKTGILERYSNFSN
ncbi:MAG: AAA family ATPase, partial [Parachlamydiales bacterium]